MSYQQGAWYFGAPMRRAAHWSHCLLLVPFVATLWPPFYNRTDPKIAGVPFFYWYQLLWIAIGAALTALVYFVTREDRRA